jgi:hypothetical protein
MKYILLFQFRGRKPAFKYIGPDIMQMNDISGEIVTLILAKLF